jgi:predicted DNA-binding mobile mystery protein A
MIYQMNGKFELIQMRQMDAKLKALRPLLTIARPTRGWIRSIRRALGMTTRELAMRLGVSQPTVFALEQSEANNKITLESLAKAAEALDCALVYALIPRTGIEISVRKQAERLAHQMVRKVSKNMELESQGIDEERIKAQAGQLVEELLAKRPRPFWK